MGMGVFRVVKDIAINKYRFLEGWLANAMWSKSPSNVLQLYHSPECGGYFCSLKSLPAAVPSISQMDKREGSDA